MLQVNPLRGVLRSLYLKTAGRVVFDDAAVGCRLETEDGDVYTIFRRVTIHPPGGAEAAPFGLFDVRFTPTADIAANLRLSKVLMWVFMGFEGFRSKYWGVNETTGECRGIYEWDTLQDVERYSKSIAVRNMTRRSKPGSVSFRVLENTAENRRFRILEVSPEERERLRRAYGV